MKKVEFTCIPIIAYMKNNIAMSRQTYGSALKDWTNVQSNILIVYPWRSNLIKRAARNSRRKPTLNEFSCLREKGKKSVYNEKVAVHNASWTRFGNSPTYSQFQHESIDNTSNHRNKIKHIPWIFEEILCVCVCGEGKSLNKFFLYVLFYLIKV